MAVACAMVMPIAAFFISSKVSVLMSLLRGNLMKLILRPRVDYGVGANPAYEW